MAARHCPVHGPVECLGESCPVVGKCQGKVCPVHGPCKDEFHLLPVADFEKLKDPKERDDRLFEVNYCIMHNAHFHQNGLIQNEIESRRILKTLESAKKDTVTEAIRQIALMAWIFTVFFMRVMNRGVQKVKSYDENGLSSDASKHYAFGVRFIEHNLKAGDSIKRTIEGFRTIYNTFSRANSSAEELLRKDGFISNLIHLYIQTVNYTSVTCIFEYECEQDVLSELHEDITGQMKDMSSDITLKREFFRCVTKRFQLVNDKCTIVLKDLHEVRKLSEKQLFETSEPIELAAIMDKKWNEKINAAFRRFENAIQASAKEIRKSLSVWINDRKNFLDHCEEISQRHPNE